MRESDPLALYSTSNKAFSRLCFIFLACALSLFVLACSDERDIPDSTYLHDGTRIHFTEQGAGTAIVFIHGFGASLVTWRLLSVHLKGDYRVILLDLKGHGHSDRRRDSRYSPEDHADVVSGLIRHLGLSRVVLVGHSFVGSTIALRLVLKGQGNLSRSYPRACPAGGGTAAREFAVFSQGSCAFPSWGGSR